MIYDLNGKLVKSLKPYLKSAEHRQYFYWDGRDNQGNEVSSGVYLAQSKLKNKLNRGAYKITLIR